MEIFGYTFRNGKLLETALTTASYRMQKPDAEDNQRLEYLGDAVLQMLATGHIFAKHPKEREGQMTARRKHMVSTQVLARAAAATDLAARLKTGPAQPELSQKTVADAVEAVLGAAWLDGGWEAASVMFDRLKLAEDASASEWTDNFKGELQVHTQAMNPPRQPKYFMIKTEGKAHSPVFTVKVAVEGLGEADGRGRTKQEAEMEAAGKMLNDIKKGSKR